MSASNTASRASNGEASTSSHQPMRTFHQPMPPQSSLASHTATWYGKRKVPEGRRLLWAIAAVATLDINGRPIQMPPLKCLYKNCGQALQLDLR